MLNILIRSFLLKVIRMVKTDSAYARRLEELLARDFKERDRQREHAKRKRQANLSTMRLSTASRKRFSRELRWALLYSGWAEGRRFEAKWIDELQAAGLRADVAETLREFAELNLVRGLYSRDVVFTEEEWFVMDRADKLGELVGRPLYLVGWTNVYCDDGLGLYVDETGNIYGDGESGYDKPGEKYLLEHFATNIEGFLELTMGAARNDSLKRLGKWFYGEAPPPEAKV